MSVIETSPKHTTPAVEHTTPVVAEHTTPAVEGRTSSQSKLLCFDLTLT